MADEIHYCKITKNGTYYHLNFLRVPKNGGKKKRKYFYCINLPLRRKRHKRSIKEKGKTENKSPES
jgi:hypothetical protein